MIRAIKGVDTQKTNSKSKLAFGYNSSTAGQLRPACIITYKPENNLSQDSFHLSKNNPTFCAHATFILPKKELFSLCDKTLQKLSRERTPEEIKQIAKEYSSSCDKMLYPEDVSRFGGEEQDLRIFRHEMANINVPIDFIVAVPDRPTAQNKFIEALADVKASVNLWEMLHKKGKIQLADFFELLKSTRSYPIELKNPELLRGKSINGYAELYFTMSQPLSNAVKYGEGKPVQIVFDEVESHGRKQLYASFINPDTKPIPDNEIDEILKGEGYRADATRDTIKGTGFGFRVLKGQLKRFEYGADIPNLIEKGRKKGVCVRVPIFGVED